MTDTDMPEDTIWIDPKWVGNNTYSKHQLEHDVIPYRLKSTVDAELAADSKTIRELSAALGVAYKALQEAEYFTSASEVKQALSDNAPRITEAQENQK